MQIPQIIIVEEVLPEVRRRTARALYGSGWSQSRIAGLLGTSQAMVSRYLKEPGRIAPSLERMVDRISQEIEVAALANASKEDLVDRSCMVIETSMRRGDMIDRYRERFGDLKVRSCYGSGGSVPSRVRVLEDLQLAVLYLMEAPITDLVPAVKINIAYAFEGASSRDDVAAFPGRIPDSNGRMLRPLPPEFGASDHLAGVLLAAVESTPWIGAAMNLRVTDLIVKIIREMEGTREMVDDGQINKERSGEEQVLFSVHPGDFGIEPCLYIFSGSPLTLVRFAVKLQEYIEGKVKEDG
ncbi:MAG: thiamine-phosphate synthase family protein [Candidatus Thermoplasmatota archaeon]|nr:thiamine-phosphate synthase family protein [Candidatus Thermoplasmatota archaeon]